MESQNDGPKSGHGAALSLDYRCQHRPPALLVAAELVTTLEQDDLEAGVEEVASKREPAHATAHDTGRLTFTTR